MGVVLAAVRATSELCIEEHPVITRRKIDAVMTVVARQMPMILNDTGGIEVLLNLKGP
jgi:hypothetical protein